MGILTEIPKSVGDYLIVEIPDSPSGRVVLCRLDFLGEDPPNSLKLGEGEGLLAFASLCPHMGCALVSNSEGSLPKDTQASGLLRCQCHFSCFDLFAQGRVAAGPATDSLAQMKLAEVSDMPHMVKLVGWVRGDDFRSGVPFGLTEPDAETSEPV